MQKMKWFNSSKNCKSIIAKPSKTNNNRSFIQPKDPKDYQNRVIHENEQAPIDFKIPNEGFQPTMVEIRIIDDSFIKKRAEKRKQLERQLSENIARLNKTKKQKTQ